MKKILICLKVPALGESYDLFVPGHLKLCEVIPLLAKAITEVAEGIYVSSNKEILCRQDPYGILPTEKSLIEIGIGNGETLLIF